MLAGILLIALPVAIVGSKFQEAYEANHAGKGKEERQNMVLDDVECPEVCKRKASSAFALISRVDEVGQEVKNTTISKRQITYHMYSEMADAVEMSPAAQHLFKRDREPHSPRLSLGGSIFSRSPTKDRAAVSPSSGRGNDQNDGARSKVQFSNTADESDQHMEPVVDQVEVFEPGREGNPDSTPEATPEHSRTGSPKPGSPKRGWESEDLSLHSHGD
jgi:hypothetical protein